MRIKVLTLFPEAFTSVLSHSILQRAQANDLLQVQLMNIRDYTLDKHRRVDDYPFGGGAGMVMGVQPISAAFEAAMGGFEGARRIYLSPRGIPLTQQKVQALSKEEGLILLCGHYEGVDQRALDKYVQEEISIGDYILSGGELAAMVLIDAVTRLIPGALGSDASIEEESFSQGLLEYPHYTRPADFMGDKVPDVLLSGHKKNIEKFRREMALDVTRRVRPELLDSAPLTHEDKVFLGWEQPIVKKKRRKKGAETPEVQ